MFLRPVCVLFKFASVLTSSQIVVKAKICGISDLLDGIDHPLSTFFNYVICYDNKLVEPTSPLVPAPLATLRFSKCIQRADTSVW